MDAKLQWQVSGDVESLVKAVLDTKQRLVTSAVLKHGMKTRLLGTDAYAGDKVLELFQLAEGWSPCPEASEDDLDTPVHRRQKKTTELVADFGAFKLHRMTVLGETDVRVVAAFDVGDMAEQVLFGNVELVTR